MSSDVPVGVYRTYVHIPDNEEFNYDNWCKYMSAGNTFLSGGPMIRLTVDGQPIGSTINLPGNGGTVEVEASADSIFPIHTLQIIQAGQVVASTEDKDGKAHLHLKANLKVDKHRGSLHDVVGRTMRKPFHTTMDGTGNHCPYLTCLHCCRW